MAAERALVSASAHHQNQFSSLCLHKNYSMINDAFFSTCTFKKHKRMDGSAFKLEDQMCLRFFSFFHFHYLNIG